MVDGHLNFDTEIDTKGFNKGVKEIQNGAKKAANSFKQTESSVTKTANGITNKLKAMGKSIDSFLGPLTALYVGSKVVQGMVSIANQAIELSSDMQEVQNVVDTAFGSMAYKAEEFADTAIDQFGMSRLAAKRTASTYMAMGKSMGLSMEAASDMAIETAKLTGDVASFYNISQDLAAIKLKGIWTGETEALKEIGVVMTEANLQQFAFNKGLTTQYKNMSQAEKVALRYEFVMDALSDAQGDFARTSDSWANQTRVLSERWKELLSIVGGGLIRVFTPVVQVINNIMAALINLANTFANTMGQLFGWNKEVKVSAGVSTDAAEGQEQLAQQTAAAGKAASGALASFDKLDVLQQDTAAGGGGVTAPTMEVVDTEPLEANETVIDKMSDRIAKLQPYVDRLRGAWDQLKTSFSNFWNSPGVQLIVEWAKDLFDTIAERYPAAFLTAWAGILDVLAGAFEILGGMITYVVGLITGDMEMAGKGFDQMVKGMVLALKGLGEIIEGVLILILGQDAVEAIKNWLSAAWEWFSNTKLYTTGIQKILQGLMKFIKGIFTRDWKLAWEGVKTIFKGVWNSIISIVESAANLIIKAINWVINQINKIQVPVPDWVTELTGMESFGFNIPNLSSVSIPRLATGAVIPPNAEFIAMLGDQKHGNNIEAPESLIRQIVREETGNGNIVINAHGTMGQLIRLLRLEIEKEDNRRGGSFVTGGAY